MSVKLTDAQLVMLSAAAQREDLCLTAPDKMKGAVLSKVSEKLVKLGLVREVRAKAGMPVWRRDDAGQSYALKLTAAGLKAIAVDDGSEEAIAPREGDATAAALLTRPMPRGPDVVGEHAKTPAPRAGSKLARVIDLLQRSDGATISNPDRRRRDGCRTRRGRRLPGCASADMPSSANGSTGQIRSTESQAPLRTAEIARSSSPKRPRTTTASLSRRRTKRRDRHGSQASHVRTGGEAAGEDNAGGFAAARCFSALDRGRSRGSRSQWAAPPMARPFGRRASCPSPALAVDESAGLSPAGRRLRRSRQVDSADASLRIRSRTPPFPSTGARLRPETASA